MAAAVPKGRLSVTDAHPPDCSGAEGGGGASAAIGVLVGGGSGVAVGSGTGVAVGSGAGVGGAAGAAVGGGGGVAVAGGIAVAVAGAGTGVAVGSGVAVGGTGVGVGTSNSRSKLWTTAPLSNVRVVRDLVPFRKNSISCPMRLTSPGFTIKP